MNEIKVEKAIEIEDGKTYVAEFEGNLNPEQMAMIQKIWREATKAKLIILHNAKLARIGEDEIREQIAKEIEYHIKKNYCFDDSFESVRSRLALHEAAAIARGKK